MPVSNSIYGLILSGGKSSRMGTDKAMLNYYGKEHVYIAYETLETLCEKTFISCRAEQAGSFDAAYNLLMDSPRFSEIGPMGALLTAYENYPGHSFLVLGCDYPFIKPNHLAGFMDKIDQHQLAHAFYNKEFDLYEPLLAWYGGGAGERLLMQFSGCEYSLQQFLKSVDASKHFPPNPKIMMSIDSPEAYAAAIKEIAGNSPGKTFTPHSK